MLVARRERTRAIEYRIPRLSRVFTKKNTRRFFTAAAARTPRPKRGIDLRLFDAIASRFHDDVARARLAHGAHGEPHAPLDDIRLWRRGRRGALREGVVRRRELELCILRVGADRSGQRESPPP